MKDYPKISIIIPVYNNEKYIINAVNSAICQGYEGAVEIIVIDDGSTDNTLKKINQRFSESEQVKIFSKENGGVSSARNYGLDKASGEYITFLELP